VAFNPYAPPAAETASIEARGLGNAPFERHRFSVALLLVIAIFTLNLYGPFWQLRRRKLVDQLDSDRKLGIALPLVAAFLLGGGIVLGVIEGVSESGGDFGENVARVGGIVALFATFRIRRILLDHCSRSGMGRDISGLGTFFFGPLYLQFKINQIADEVRHEYNAYDARYDREPRHAPEVPAQVAAADDYDARLDAELAEMRAGRSRNGSTEPGS